MDPESQTQCLNSEKRDFETIEHKGHHPPSAPEQHRQCRSRTGLGEGFEIRGLWMMDLLKC